MRRKFSFNFKWDITNIIIPSISDKRISMTTIIDRGNRPGYVFVKMLHPSTSVKIKNIRIEWFIRYDAHVFVLDALQLFMIYSGSRGDQTGEAYVNIGLTHILYNSSFRSGLRELSLFISEYSVLKAALAFCALSAIAGLHLRPEFKFAPRYLTEGDQSTAKFKTFTRNHLTEEF